MLWVMTLAAGVFLALMVPPLWPVLAACAPVLFLVPCAAAAGHIPHLAKQYEAVGEWSWVAWRYRAAGFGMACLVLAG